jgi:hypothetical protein
VFLWVIWFAALVWLALAPQARAATFIGSHAIEIREAEEARQFARLSVRNGVGARKRVGGSAYASCSTGSAR